MKVHYSGAPPGSDIAHQPDGIQQLVEFWNLVRTEDDPGSTEREVLEDLERRVTDCLYSSPPDVVLAKRLTVKAMALMTGIEDP